MPTTVEAADSRAADVPARERKLLQALDMSDTGLWAWDLATDTTTWNDACFRVHEQLHDGTPLSGERFFECVHEDDREMLREHVQAAIAGRTRFDCEFRVRRPDGAIRWFASQGRAVHDDAGQALEMLGSVRDITEQKRVEHGWRDSQERLRAAVEASGLGLWTWDMATDAVTWSSENYRIHGLREGDFDGTGASFFALVHPGDRDRVQATVRAAIERNERYECEFRIVRPNGDIAWVTNRGRARYDDNGAPVSMLGTIADISATKEADQLLQAALAASRTGTFRWDIRNNGLEWDHALDHLFGVEPGEVVRSLEQFVALVHPEDRQGVIDRCERCRATGADFEMEFRVLWPDGTLHWLYDRGQTFRDHTGQPAWMTGACVDITERKAMEEELRRGELFYRQVLDSLPGMTFTADAAGHVDYLTEQWEAFTGVPASQLLGDGWGALLHPEEHARISAAWKASLNGGPPYDVEYRLRGADGEYRWFKTRSRALRDLSGEVVRWIGTAINIHDLKVAQAAAQASRERLARAQRAGRVGIWERHIGKDSVVWSEETARLFDLWPEDLQAVPFAAVRERILPEDLPLFQAAIARGMTEGHFREEYRVQHRDGSVHWLESEADVHCDAHGKPVRMTGTLRDVTERRAAEAALKESDRLKDEFLATLAHELRNPLAPLRTGVEVLRRGGGNQRSALDMMERQLRHMVHLVDDLLDVSRISRGQVEIRSDRLDISTIVDHALEIARPLVVAHGHALTVHPLQDPVWVQGDLTRLSQVLGNLLNNAAKYTPDGGRIELAVAVEQGEVAIRVSDNGVGIAPEMQPRIFDLFVQVGDSLHRAQGGLGIGLSLVNKLVELHGGKASVHSEGLGRGSTFTVRLPLASPAPIEVLPAAGAQVPGEGAVAVRRVLVVDDNVDGGEAMAMMLEMAGHEVRFATDGPSGIARAREFGPEVVFLDIGLPGMSGYDVARQFRADPQLRGAMLVALTGWGSADDKRKCMEAGFDLHLTKPVDPQAIEDAVATRPLPHGPRLAQLSATP